MKNPTKPPKAKAAKPIKAQWKKIGEVCVDTGTIVIGDPCHFDTDTIHGVEAGQVRGEKMSTRKKMPVAVVVPTGIGDGCYDVHALFVDHPTFGRRIAEVRMAFLDSDGACLGARALEDIG